MLIRISRVDMVAVVDAMVHARREWEHSQPSYLATPTDRLLCFHQPNQVLRTGPHFLAPTPLTYAAVRYDTDTITYEGAKNCRGLDANPALPCSQANP